MNKKNNKRGLGLSLLCLLLCTTMLIGSTFAWFTDTDTTTVSNIVSGTLDLEIVNTAGDKLDTMDFVNIDGSSNILWEPNATFKTNNFFFKNVGNLWLKMKVELNNTEVSYNKLNSVIDFTLVNADTKEEVKLDEMVDIAVEPNTAKGPYYIKGHMDENAGNEYQGLTLSGVSITAYAAQYSSEKDMTDATYDENAVYDGEVVTVGTPDEFIAAFANFEDEQTITLTADIDMTGKTWNAISLANKTLTVRGGGNTVTGLSDGLIKNTGSGSITIADITFDKMKIASSMWTESDFESSALVANADTCSYINMTNVTVTNSTINSAKYAAALVGYTTGYGNDFDGPVYASHNFTNCVVTGTTVNGGGSAGAIVAHAGGNKATTTTINGIEISSCTIKGEDAAHTGTIIGTSHVGEVFLTYDTNKVQSGNAIGRFVPGTTGKLVINGVEQTAFAN